MSKAKHVVFDCDDVLFNLRDTAAAATADIMGIDVTPEDFIDPHIPACFSEITPETDAAITDWFINGIDLVNLPPDQHAVTTLHTLKKNDYKISIVTARGTIPNGRERTIEAFKRNNMPYDELHVVPYHKSKRDTLAQLGEVDLYVEDNHHHVESARGLNNIKMINLMRRPWNLSFRKEIGRCDDSIRTISTVNECFNHLPIRNIDSRMKYWMRRHGIKVIGNGRWACTAFDKNTNRHLRVLKWIDQFQICDGYMDRWANSVGATVPVPYTEKDFDNALTELYKQSEKSNV